MSPSGMARPQPIIPPGRKRHRFSLLPSGKGRKMVALSLRTSVDVNLELYSLLVRKAKNQVADEILSKFLAKPKNSCPPMHDEACPAQEKTRVTFVITKELQEKLDGFVNRVGCNQTRVVSTALTQFLRHQGIDPFTDPSERLLDVLRSHRSDLRRG